MDSNFFINKQAQIDMSQFNTDNAAKAIQEMASQQLKSDAWRDVGHMGLAALGIGVAGRGLIGLYNVIKRNQAKKKTGPALLPLPIPVEKQALSLAGNDATTKSGIPWYGPAMLGAGLGGLGLGWGGIDALLNARRQAESESELNEARQQFHDALLSQYEKPKVLPGTRKKEEKTAGDNTMEKVGLELNNIWNVFEKVLTKHAQSWFDNLKGQALSGYGVYSGLSGLLSGAIVYNAMKKRSQQAILEKALQKRERRKFMQSPTEIQAVPEPIEVGLDKQALSSQVVLGAVERMLGRSGLRAIPQKPGIIRRFFDLFNPINPRTTEKVLAEADAATRANSAAYRRRASNLIDKLRNRIVNDDPLHERLLNLENMTRNTNPLSETEVADLARSGQARMSRQDIIPHGMSHTDVANSRFGIPRAILRETQGLPPLSPKTLRQLPTPQEASRARLSGQDIPLNEGGHPISEVPGKSWLRHLLPLSLGGIGIGGTTYALSGSPHTENLPQTGIAPENIQSETNKLLNTSSTKPSGMPGYMPYLLGGLGAAGLGYGAYRFLNRDKKKHV